MRNLVPSWTIVVIGLAGRPAERWVQLVPPLEVTQTCPPPKEPPKAAAMICVFAGSMAMARQFWGDARGGVALVQEVPPLTDLMTFMGWLPSASAPPAHSFCAFGGSMVISKICWLTPIPRDRKSTRL